MNPQTYAVVLVSENNVIYFPITWLNYDSQNTPFIGANHTYSWPLINAVKEVNKYAVVNSNWTKRSGKLLKISGKIVINQFLYFIYKYLLICRFLY